MLDIPLFVKTQSYHAVKKNRIPRISMCSEFTVMFFFYLLKMQTHIGKQPQGIRCIYLGKKAV